LALGILAALLERDRSGRGQVVDAAMVDGASTLMSFLHGMHAAGMWQGERGTNLLDGGASFYDTYETADGKFMAVGAVESKFYSELLRGLGIIDEGAGQQLDPTRWPDERERFREAFRRKTRSEWTEIFSGTDACVTPVLSPWEAALHPHNVARKSFISVDGVVQPAPAPRFGRSIPATPKAMDEGGRDPSKSLTDWGLDPVEIGRLLESEAVI
jgi:alpha-methylacyl-CoA racemase